MRAISKSAQRVFDRLVEGLTRVGDHNKHETPAFMAVSVEVIDRTRDGSLIVSVAHYFTQNGDLMADPEMTFLYTTADGKAYPLSFRQDSTGTYWVGAWQADDGRWMLRPRMQRDHAIFAATWLRNIREQHNLRLTKGARR